MIRKVLILFQIAICSNILLICCLIPLLTHLVEFSSTLGIILRFFGILLTFILAFSILQIKLDSIIFLPI